MTKRILIAMAFMVALSASAVANDGPSNLLYRDPSPPLVISGEAWPEDRVAALLLERVVWLECLVEKYRSVATAAEDYNAARDRAWSASQEFSRVARQISTTEMSTGASIRVMRAELHFVTEYGKFDETTRALLSTVRELTRCAVPPLEGPTDD